MAGTEGCDPLLRRGGGEWAGDEGTVWWRRVGKSLGLMSFLLLRPVGASGGGDPFCRCTGRKEGASAGRSLLQAVLWRDRSRSVPAEAVWACAGPSSGRSFAAARRGGRKRLFRRPGSPPGFPGIFALLLRGRFARRVERGANALLAGGMMGSLALSLAGGSARAAAEALPFCPMGERLGGGEGLPGGLLAGCARGARHCAVTGKRSVGDGRGERRSGAAAARSSAAGGRCRWRLGGGQLGPSALWRGGLWIAYGKRGGGLL